MEPVTKVALTVVGAAAAWEFGWWLKRRHDRQVVYEMALARARELHKPLVVVGAPDGGVTSGYPCGDVTVDLAPSVCPNPVQADITHHLPFADNSVIVFVSCVLEYVDDYEAAVAELRRVSGGEIFIVRVEPWTLSAFFYPGAKRRLWASDMRAIPAEPFAPLQLTSGT